MDRLGRTQDTKLGRISAFPSRAKISAEGDTSKDGNASKKAGRKPPLDLDAASSWSDDMQGLGCADPTRSILLRFECMTGSELKVSVRFLNVDVQQLCAIQPSSGAQALIHHALCLSKFGTQCSPQGTEVGRLQIILLALYTLLFIGLLALAALITVKNMLVRLRLPHGWLNLKYWIVK